MNKKTSSPHTLKLTNREIECLNLAAEGNTFVETAAKLYIAPRTVKYHFKNIKDKLQARNKTHAVSLALTHHYIVLKTSHELCNSRNE